MSLTLPPFRLHRPRRLEEALGVLRAHDGESRVLAGGTDLVVNLRQRLLTPRHVVSLARIPELRGIRSTRAGLRIGALTTLTELTRSAVVLRLAPLLAEAAAAVSGPTLRSMGTVGGNLCLDTRCHWYNQSLLWRQGCGFCLKKGGAVCHVAPGSETCLAAYCGDLAPALLALGAEVVLCEAGSERRRPLSRFFLEDGTKKFDLRPSEVLTEVRVPTEGALLAGSYGKLRVRGAIDYPQAGVAVAGRVTRSGTFADVSVALTAVGPRPFLVEGIGELLEGKGCGDDGAIGEAAEMVKRATNPLRTGGPFPVGYRRLRVGLFARDGLRTLARRKK